MKLIVFRAVLVSLGLLLGVISAEFLMRSTLDLFECDVALGWRFSADARGLKVGRQGSFVQPIAINSHGFRDLERAVERQEGVGRIAVLGDSIVAALQVPQTRRFSSLLEEKVNEHSGRDALEVLNFGVDGYGTAQELIVFEEEVRRFAPDLVLLFVYPFNDLRDNLPAEGGGNHYLAARCGRPYFEVEGETLKALGNAGPAPASGLDGTLRRWSLLYGNLVRPANRDAARSVLRASDVYDPEHPPALRRAVGLAVRLAAELDRAATEAGAGFGVVLVPDRRQAGERDPTRAQQLASPMQALSVELDGSGIAHLDLLPIIRRYVAEGGSAYLEHDPHFDEKGHEVVAEAVHAWLEQSCGQGIYSARVCAGAGLESLL